MKRKWMIGLVIAVVCIAAGALFFMNAIPKGDTVESREEMLNDAIFKGQGWTIQKETELDGYLISAACNADHMATLAVFKPAGDGRYELQTSTNRKQDEIIVSGTMVDGSWYDLIWFGGAQTEYAEVTYTIDGQEQEPLKFDTTQMDIICNPNPAKEYTLSVVYYDRDGNRYE